MKVRVIRNNEEAKRYVLPHYDELPLRLYRKPVMILTEKEVFDLRPLLRRGVCMILLPDGRVIDTRGQK